mgnify:FL=1
MTFYVIKHNYIKYENLYYALFGKKLLHPDLCKPYSIGINAYPDPGYFFAKFAQIRIR